MPLLLATHTLVEAPTATVPFHVIVLNDLIKRRALPAALRCRMILPTSSGTVRPQQRQRSRRRQQRQQRRVAPPPLPPPPCSPPLPSEGTH